MLFSGFENEKNPVCVLIAYLNDMQICVKLMLIYVCLIYINMMLGMKHDL